MKNMLTIIGLLSVSLTVGAAELQSRQFANIEIAQDKNLHNFLYVR